MSYYVLEVRNDTGTKQISREVFNTKKAVLKAYRRLMDSTDPTKPIGVRSKIVVRILHYPS